MAWQARDLKTLEAGAQNLAQLIGRKDIAAGQIQAQERAAQAKREQDVADQEKLMGLIGPGGPMEGRGGAGGGISVAGQPSDIGLANLMERQKTAKRLETKELAGQFERTLGDTRKKVQAVEDALSLLQNPSGLTAGQLQTALARLRDVGALSEGDVERALPMTARRLGSRAATFFGQPDLIDPYNVDEVNKIRQMLEARREAFTTQAGRSRQELEQRAEQLAPTLAEGGELRPVLQSLGQSIPQGEAPAQAPLSPADQQALDWARANPNDPRAAQIMQRLGR